MSDSPWFPLGEAEQPRAQQQGGPWQPWGQPPPPPPPPGQGGWPPPPPPPPGQGGWPPPPPPGQGGWPPPPPPPGQGGWPPPPPPPADEQPAEQPPQQPADQPAEESPGEPAAEERDEPVEAAAPAEAPPSEIDWSKPEPRAEDDTGDQELIDEVPPEVVADADTAEPAKAEDDWSTPAIHHHVTDEHPEEAGEPEDVETELPTGAAEDEEVAGETAEPLGAEVPPAAVAPAPVAPAPVSDGAGPDAAYAPGLAALGAEIAGLRSKLDEVVALRQRDTDLADKMHAEIVKLRGGEVQAVMTPLLAQLLRLHDRMVSLSGGDPQSVAGMLQTQLLQALDTAADVRPFNPQPGEPFDTARHLGAARVPTQDAQADGTIARVVKPGFERSDGSVVRVAEVDVYRFG